MTAESLAALVRQLLILVLLVEVVSLALNAAALGRFNRDSAHKPDSEELRQERQRATTPVIASAYGTLVVGGGLLVAWLLRPPVGPLVGVLVVLMIPAMLSDMVMALWRARNRKSGQEDR
jgi:divalent metal cation (Fe/Co/Zn/Cd) transporter